VGYTSYFSNRYGVLLNSSVDKTILDGVEILKVSIYLDRQWNPCYLSRKAAVSAPTLFHDSNNLSFSHKSTRPDSGIHAKFSCRVTSFHLVRVQ
jgi:hypothetical protein